MKDDERLFLVTVARERPRPVVGLPRADAIGVRLGIHPKRVLYLLDKWAGKGWWNYGVSLRGGWLEPAGVAKADELAPELPTGPASGRAVRG